jgi:hypothetical protein
MILGGTRLAVSVPAAAPDLHAQELLLDGRRQPLFPTETAATPEATVVLHVDEFPLVSPDDAAELPHRLNSMRRAGRDREFRRPRDRPLLRGAERKDQRLQKNAAEEKRFGLNPDVARRRCGGPSLCGGGAFAGERLGSLGDARGSVRGFRSDSKIGQ